MTTRTRTTCNRRQLLLEVGISRIFQRILIRFSAIHKCVSLDGYSIMMEMLKTLMLRWKKVEKGKKKKKKRKKTTIRGS